LFRKLHVPLVCAISLLLLAVAPVYAAPSLSLGSTASYALSGQIQASQNCTAVPANYTLQACYGITPLPPPPPPAPPPTITVWIEDNGVCQANELSCKFVPAVVNASQGSTVIWKNNGTLAHMVSSNSSGATFSSGSIAPKGNFSYTFKFGGTYQYNDPLYAWMKGTINIPIILHIPEPPGSTQSVTVYIPSNAMQVGLSGTVGWTVEGLSSSQANLLVSHNIAISVSPIPLVSFTPVTESGSFEQSIDLSTRVESPGTATSIVKSVLGSVLEGLSSTAYTGYPGTLFQTMLSGQSNGPDYTQWWVNGPLSKGSPVQILDGWSSVTGSQSLNLGSGLGTRSAWIVTSQLSQSVNVTSPNINNPFGQSSISNASANLKLLWSYDQSADLLLRNDNAVSLTMHSVTPTTIYIPMSCGSYTCYSPISVTVTRDTTATIDLALLLSSTSLGLPKSPSHAATLMDALAAMPWMPLGLVGLAAAAIIGLVLWLTRRTRGTVLLGPTPAPTHAPSSTPPS
jgi:hypothetical protein